MVPIVFVLFVMGAVAGSIGQDRGHPFWEWFLAGFVLGPFGIAWSLFHPRTPDNEARRQRAIDAARTRLDEADPS